MATSSIIFWNALAAVGTILPAIVALGIALFTYIRSVIKDKKSREKEAAEKILTPIRKELYDLLGTKWAAWYPANRWHTLESTRLDFPLQYFWLDKKIKKQLENFDTQWLRFEYLSNQERENFKKLVVNGFNSFLSTTGITIKFNGASNIPDEAINNIHWSCVIGGKSGAAVTIHSLILWESSLSDYIGLRKKENDIPNTQVDKIDFSIFHSGMHIELIPKPTLKQSDSLLFEIEKEIKKYPNVKEYRNKWRELYEDGVQLMKEIDSWLSTQ